MKGLKGLVAATLVGLTIAATVSTSASAFQCLAWSTNGVAVWGYGIFFSRARSSRHAIVALLAGSGCYIAFCR